MCGIVGQLSNSSIRPEVFNRMRDSMTHRGPDGMGSTFLHDNKVALGHRRLSIIDLSNLGHQPMANEDGTIWITYNGEIYNFVHIRRLLISSGRHTFKSNTDTEVILHGYEEWGIEGLLNRLKGMFAFAIWDNKLQQLFLARDRFGIKPLVYFADNSNFVFASELKALAVCPEVPRIVDDLSLADYFIYSYIPYPKTIWKNIYKLSPSHYLKYDFRTGQIDIQKYWQLHSANNIISNEEAVFKTQEILRQSIADHLVSDVPIGLFLSGGYDSSTLLMNMSAIGYKTNCFTIAFPDSSHNESIQASELASFFGVHHQIESIQKNTDVFSLLEEMSPIYDEPFAGDSMINTWLISRLAARHCKVALSGEGADELFAGYKWHRKIESYYNEFNIKQRIKNILNGYLTSQDVFLSLYNRSMLGVTQEVINSYVLNNDLKKNIAKRSLWHFTKHDNCDSDPVKRTQILDTNTFIPNHCLYRADLSSMAHSLEVRVPFLDHELYEFVFSLRRNVYMKNGIKKFLLEENLKNKVPASILDMPKRGFSFQNLENIYDDRFTSLISNGELVKRDIIQKGLELETLSSRFKFHLLNLELWMRNHD